MTASLPAVAASHLLQQPLAEPVWVVEGLLPTGLHILAGAPKVGKSWLALDLAVHVSRGVPFWELATDACEVLYLSLEDTYPRVQRRLWQLTDEVGREVWAAVSANSIPGGLVAQMAAFCDEHPGVGLVIIDTLQTVREASRDGAYASDYGDVGALKRFADERSLALVAVHHTRKMGDADALNTVSGTTGITGSADSTMVLTRDSRGSGLATMRITGRDIEYQELRLRFRDCRWELVERVSEEEIEEREVPDCVLSVLSMALERGSWRGSAAELAADAGVPDVSPAALGKRLAQHRSFLSERGVSYGREHTRTGNVITLEAPPREGGEPCEGAGGAGAGAFTGFTGVTDADIDTILGAPLGTTGGV